MDAVAVEERLAAYAAEADRCERMARLLWERGCREEARRQFALRARFERRAVDLLLRAGDAREAV